MKSTSPTFVKLYSRVRKLVIGLTIVSAIFVTLFVVHSQTPSDPTLKGESSNVLLLPNSVVNAGEVRFKPDSDHDGMSDEAEAANGTDPNNASDADGDNDGDGLSNGDEVASGSSINNADSDGDGVSDGEEVRLGYNPTDPSSVPPVGVTLVAIQVTPNPATLVINTVLGQQPVQLTVTGLLSNASTVDLTSAVNTVYESTNPSVALVSSVGVVAGVSTGVATINVVNGSRSAQTTVSVAPFAPRLMSFLQLTGEVNNVDVSGDLAYVAVGSAGIQIVDVSDRRAPHIVTTLDTSGIANDIRVVGNLAYVADGDAGLKIIDVSNPAGPFLRGTINTPGDARDVVVYGARAYVADGTAGLQIIDVSNPAAPAIVRTVDTPGTASGVDIDGNIAVVADRSPTSGVRIIDITNEAGAQIVGTLNMPSNVEDLVTRDSLAYCAGASNGLFIVDFSAPTLPVLRGQHTANETGFFIPNDVALAGDFVLAAEIRFTNAVPIDDVSDPSDPRYRGSLDYSTTGSYDGTGIALDPGYAYTTAFSDMSESRLYIGQYQPVDAGGIPPTVSLTSPSAGVTFMEGQPIDLEASASDDIEVVGVQFKANGSIAGPLQTSAPYRLKVFVPFSISSLTLTATAFDTGANATVSQPVTVNVIPDPGTTVIGRVVDRFNQPMANATVKAFEGYSTVAGADGRFSFYAPSVLGNSIHVLVAAERDGQPFAGISASVPLIVSGVTDLGDVMAKPTGQIAFVRRPPNQFEAEIYVMDAKGENETRLTFNAARVFEPLFSPDGLKIAFNRDDYCGRNVWVMNADGSNQMNISPGQTYVWSPDSRKLAYNFNNSIYLSNSDGSDKKALTDIGYDAYTPPTWSPDGMKLGYIGRDINGKSDLYTINADGSNRQKITNTLTTKYEVAWSPNGAWIAYVQYDGNREKVFAIHPDGSGLIQLSTQDAFYYDMSWMPDSNKVLVVNDPSQGSSINLLDVNGGAPFRVTNNGTAYDWGPAVSADGVTIAFASDDGLLIVNRDGTGQKLLNADGWDPSFRPEVIQAADPGTAVTGRVVDALSLPVPNATLKLFGQTVGTSAADGSFSLSGVSALKGNLTIIASAASGGGIESGFSAAVAPVAGGVTQLGDVRIAQNIAFISERDGNAEVYLMDADGNNQRRVTSTDSNESRPSLSPDGTKFAYVSDRDGHDEIYVMNLDGSNPVRVSYLQFSCFYGDSDPEWSPDGTKILFTGGNTVYGFTDIYVVNSDATNQQRLTTNSVQDYMPSWLPDGSRILFVSYRDSGYGEIYVMNADGSNQTRITNNASYEREPSWSPDNTKIAFSSFRDGRDSIFVINVDGSNEVQVTTDAANNDYPAWSRDSLRLLFSSNADVNYQIYVINVDGTNRLRLSNNTFDDLQPDW